MKVVLVLLGRWCSSLGFGRATETDRQAETQRHSERERDIDRDRERNLDELSV